MLKRRFRKSLRLDHGRGGQGLLNQQRYNRPPRPQRFWRDIWNSIVWYGKRARSVLLSISAVLTVVLVFAFLFKALIGRQLSIEPISVPKTLAEDGYTPEVAARQFREALNRVVAA